MARAIDGYAGSLEISFRLSRARPSESVGIIIDSMSRPAVIWLGQSARIA